MQDSLKAILEIQELDMKMIRLMRVKKERQKELIGLCNVKDKLNRAQKSISKIHIKRLIALRERFDFIC